MHDSEHATGLPNVSPSRRSLFATVAAVAALGATKAASAAPGASHPDAELIAASKQHIINRAAFNASGESGEGGPLWRAYCETYEAMENAEPQTLAGVVALARASAAEPNGLEGNDGYWDAAVVHALIRIAGGVA